MSETLSALDAALGSPAFGKASWIRAAVRAAPLRSPRRPLAKALPLGTWAPAGPRGGSQDSGVGRVRPASGPPGRLACPAALGRGGPGSCGKGQEASAGGAGRCARPGWARAPELSGWGRQLLPRSGKGRPPRLTEPRPHRQPCWSPRGPAPAAAAFRAQRLRGARCPGSAEPSARRPCPQPVSPRSPGPFRQSRGCKGLKAARRLPAQTLR